MRIRPLEEDDRELLRQWVLKAHGLGRDSGIFFEKESLVIEDSEHKPQIFLMQTPVTRIDVQFDPFHVDPFRNTRGFVELQRYFGKKELIFDSTAQQLIQCMERFGFRHEPDTFVRRRVDVLG